MDLSGLARIDSFPYRHRVAELADTPAITGAGNASLAEATAAMTRAGASSVVIVDDGGRPAGILTERDILRAIAAEGATALTASVLDRMSRPVVTVAADDLVHVALARMARTGFRHLVVVDESGHVAGVVTAHGLLRQRAGDALALGDDIATADAAALGRAVALLPAVARTLRDEGVDARAVAAVVAATIRDVTGRAAALAAGSMLADGRGPPPAPWACLVLGSAGRGETLLVPDQDNALVWADGAPADSDAWFALLGDRLAAILAGAGISYCKGGVMASNPAWRGAMADWRARIAGWLSRHRPQDLLNVDIFFDAAPVAGDRDLGRHLLADAVAAARARPVFLKLLGEQATERGSPFGLFGGLRSEGGRIDVKRTGLLPVVAAARVAALAAGRMETATPARLAAMAPRANDATRETLDDAHALMMKLLLDQQLADIATGIAPSNLVALAPLSRATRRRLAEALHALDGLPLVVRDLLRAE